MRSLRYIFIAISLAACGRQSSEPSIHTDRVITDTGSVVAMLPIDSLPIITQEAETLLYTHPDVVRINTKAVRPEELVAFAQTLNGIPYIYASCNPAAGFDCSGFVFYVFNHFEIEVPRSSIDFTNVGKEIDRNEAKPGDLILFTGTDSSDRRVGHMGIIVSNENDSLRFIHSSSGKANGVTITPLNEYYKGRFMKVIRVFRQNESK